MFEHTNNKGCATTRPVNVRTHKQQGLYNNRTSECSYTQTTRVVQQQDQSIFVHTNNKGSTTTGTVKFVHTNNKGSTTTGTVNRCTHKQQGLYNNRTLEYSYTQATRIVQQHDNKSFTAT